MDPYALGVGTLGSIASTEQTKINGLILASDLEENNLVGMTGYSYVSGDAQSVQAGGVLSLTSRFAGYLVDPKAYANRGTIASLYAPSLIVANGVVGQIMKEGAFWALVTATTDITIEDHIWVNELDGSLVAQSPDVKVLPGYRFGFAKVVNYNSSYTVGSNGPNAVVRTSASITLPGYY